MGTIRFLLAAAVVFGHAPGWGLASSARFIAPYYAVQCFFVISGFYMALIWKRYEGRTLIFYTNRYSRLIVPYLIVSAVTLYLAPFPFWPVHHVTAFEAVTNLTMFGLDTVQFFQYAPAYIYTVIPPSWSLGAELWFYLLVPFLVPLRTRTLLIMLAASVALRIAIAQTSLPFFPWQQRFFPEEIAFFLSGILAYRIGPRLDGRVALAALIALVGLSGIQALHWGMSLALAAALFVLIPSTFERTKRSAVDRWIGEFSYPVYLWHIVIGYAIPATQTNGAVLLAASVMASAPLVLLVEIPMERWRRRRLDLASLAERPSAPPAALRDQPR